MQPMEAKSLSQSFQVAKGKRVTHNSHYPKDGSIEFLKGRKTEF